MAVNVAARRFNVSINYIYQNVLDIPGRYEVDVCILKVK